MLRGHRADVANEVGPRAVPLLLDDLHHDRVDFHQQVLVGFVLGNVFALFDHHVADLVLDLVFVLIRCLLPHHLYLVFQIRQHEELCVRRTTFLQDRKYAVEQLLIFFKSV